MVFVSATVVTGLIVYGGDQGAGPLAGIVSKETGEALEEVHELIANITLGARLPPHLSGGPCQLRASREFGPRHDYRLQAALTAVA